MDRQELVVLEQAIEPYRRSGFVVTSQSDGAITLALPPEKFSYVLFIILLVVWPLAVLYLISHNNQRGKSVCLRITSQGYVEASGYTLKAIAREKRRRKFITLMFIVVLALVLLFILMRVYLARGI
jgi:hypothetical protein